MSFKIDNELKDLGIILLHQRLRTCKCSKEHPPCLSCDMHNKDGSENCVSSTKISMTFMFSDRVGNKRVKKFLPIVRKLSKSR